MISNKRFSLNVAQCQKCQESFILNKINKILNKTFLYVFTDSNALQKRL